MIGIAQMDVASADWLKTIFVMAPWLTILSVARIWANVKLHSFLPKDTDPDYLAYREEKLQERKHEVDMQALRG